jgi:hypothetical protein
LSGCGNGSTSNRVADGDGQRLPTAISSRRIESLTLATAVVTRDETPLAPGDAARLSAADCMFAVADLRLSISVCHSVRLPRPERLDWISCAAALSSRDVGRLPWTGVRVSCTVRRPATS